MRKTLRILCVGLVFLIPACNHQSEVTVATTTTSTTTTSTTLPPSTTTTAPPTTTTTVVHTTTTAAQHTVHAASVTVWDAIANCESGGNWAKRGSRYDGGLQFSPGTWTSYVAAGKPYGLVGYPTRAYSASREQQILVAIRVRDGVPGSSAPYLNAQGYGAWPTCRHAAGV